MSTTLPDSASARHLLNLEDVHPSMAKADLNPIDVDWRRAVGRALQRCFALAGLSQKEAAALLNRDPAQIARWCAATERPQFDTIFSVDRFRQPIVQALSEMAGADVEVTVRLRRLG